MSEYSDDKISIEDQVKYLLDTLEVAKRDNNRVAIKGIRNKLKFLNMKTEKKARFWLKMKKINLG
jgi:hypothetical protein